MSEFNDIKGLWNYNDLANNIVIGEGSWIEQKKSFERFNSNQDIGLTIGKRVKVYTWTFFNVDPQGRLEIGDDCILVGAIFMCAEHISIGNRVVISYNVTIADSDFHPIEPMERMEDAIASAPQSNRKIRPLIKSNPVVIEDDVWIGIGVIILKGVRIGKGARIAAGSIVTSDVLAGSTVTGNPAR